MTAFDSWLKTTVLAAAGDAPRDAVFEQRIAISLIQARAIECRALAGQLSIAADPGPRMIAAACMDRSHKLEQLGLKYAKEWPPEWWEAGRIIQ